MSENESFPKDQYDTPDLRIRRPVPIHSSNIGNDQSRTLPQFSPLLVSKNLGSSMTASTSSSSINISKPLRKKRTTISHYRSLSAIFAPKKNSDKDSSTNSLSRHKGLTSTSLVALNDLVESIGGKFETSKKSVVNDGASTSGIGINLASNIKFSDSDKMIYNHKKLKTSYASSVNDALISMQSSTGRLPVNESNNYKDNPNLAIRPPKHSISKNLKLSEWLGIS